MKITDINGLDLEIDNFALAIMQADDYRHYEYTDPNRKTASEKHKAYWEDFYQKLIIIQQ